MKSRSEVCLWCALVALPVASVLISLNSKSSARTPVSAPAEKRKPALLASDRVGAIADEPIAPFQVELLELAANAASRLPLRPHIKSRSRAQEKVVTTCLELDQPRRAAKYIESIDNWRRGLNYADLAFYCAKRGNTTDVQHYLDLAGRIADGVEKVETEGDEQGETWRYDRIRADIARTHAWLGNKEKATEFEAGVADSEGGRAAAVAAMRAEPDDFDPQFDSLSAVVKTGNFDQTRNALEVCAQLYNRFFDDAERRAACKELITASWSKLPLQVRFDLLVKMSGFALEHGDHAEALALLDDASKLLDGYPWSPEHRIPLMTQLAAARHHAGDTEQAKALAQSALAAFDAGRDKILGVDRAATLRCIAEAFVALGDSTQALAVYRRAVEVGAENPNARPRAEDLTATCCSMAQHAVEPDAELKARLQSIYEKLGDPW